MKSYDYICYFDGACTPINPNGAMGMGVIIYDSNEKVVHTISEYQEPKEGNSNNVAEHLAFGYALNWFLNNELNQKRILFKGDSMLVVRQISGFWRIKKGFYVSHALENKELMKSFPNSKIEWIPREENSEADYYSNENIPIYFRHDFSE